MFFTKVYGDIWSTKYVSYLKMLQSSGSISHDAGAFSNDSLFQISSLGHRLQKASLKSRTISHCCPVLLPCLHVFGEPGASWDAGPFQQWMAKPSSTPAFCFSSPRWKHSQINANFKRGLLRCIRCYYIMSMSLLSSYLAVFHQNVVLYM